MAVLRAALTKSLSLSSPALAFVSALLPDAPTATVPSSPDAAAAIAAIAAATPTIARFDSLTGVGGF